MQWNVPAKVGHFLQIDVGLQKNFRLLAADDQFFCTFVAGNNYRPFQPTTNEIYVFKYRLFIYDFAIYNLLAI